MKQNNNEFFQANIRVSNNIRKFLENNGDRLYIGLTSCKIYDHFYIKRCNKCQAFDHYAVNCKSTTSVCLHCVGNHASDTCSEKCKSDLQTLCKT